MADKDLNIKITTSADTAGAEKALEAVQKVAEAQREATATSSGGNSGANPFTDGSQLRSGAASDPEPVREKTEAIVEQAEALEDLTDAEAGVIDATKRLDQTAGQAKGFKDLFDQQRLQAIGKEIGQLGQTVGDLTREFLKTEAGQQLFAGLSEETKAFGSIALQTGTAVAQGWAQGGPIGAALAGLNVLVKEVGESFVAVARAEEEAARSFAAEQDRIAAQTRERRKEAASDAIEKQIARENDKLEDQSEILREQQGLLQSRKELANADFDLKQAQDRAAGKSEDQLEIERVQKELRDKENEIKGNRSNRQDERNLIERERDALGIRAENARRMGDPEKKKQFEEDQAKADEELRDAERADAAKRAEEDNLLEAARRRAAARLTDIATRSRGDAENDTERRARERDTEAGRNASRTRAETERRQGIGREAESVADSAARGADPRQAAALEQIGNRLAANPDAANFDALTQALERMLAALDQSETTKAAQLRRHLERIERIEAKLKTKGDGGNG